MTQKAKSFKSLKCTQSGQSMVEFALVVTFIFLLFVGIVQMILLMYAYNTLANAAKEGVRYAVTHGTSLGASSCSGPGTGKSVTPPINCTDNKGDKVVSYGVMPFAAASFQNISTTNNNCTTPVGNTINVCYDPNKANSSNSSFQQACSEAGCLVSVTISHTYSPLFGFGWPTFTLNAAATGTIAN